MFFFIESARGNKDFTFKLIIQGLLRLYNRDVFFDLTKMKALFMASIGKVDFNVDILIIHSTLNILVE
jgi:hypothetical protein